MGERHRPAITRSVADLGQGEGWVYRLRCTCPSLVLDTHSKDHARQRRRQHLEEVDTDPSERCGDQLPLFDL